MSAVEKIELSQLSTRELVEFHNIMAGLHADVRPVTKFRDRSTAERRLQYMLDYAREYIGVDRRFHPINSREELESQFNRSAEGAPMTEEQQTTETTQTAEEPADFDVRAGSKRDKLISRLKQDEGRQVPQSELIEAVYGQNAEPEMKGPLNMVFKGLKDTIESKSLPYEIRREKVNQEISFGLYKTD